MLRGVVQKLETLQDGSIKLSISMDRSALRKAAEYDHEEVVISLSSDVVENEAGAAVTVPGRDELLENIRKACLSIVDAIGTPNAETAQSEPTVNELPVTRQEETPEQTAPVKRVGFATEKQVSAIASMLKRHMPGSSDEEKVKFVAESINKELSSLTELTRKEADTIFKTLREFLSVSQAR